MLIHKLKLTYFGRFHGLELDFKPGINLIYGENEAGKSTIHTFIKGMLFGVERMRGRAAASKEDLYSRYLPWDYTGAFSGAMDIAVGDKRYRLQRSFHASDKYFTVIDMETGREVKLKESHISELVPGLTETAYKNTISIEQLKAQTDAELAAQVNNYIANLSVSKCKEVNVTKALKSLTEQKKVLEAAMNTTEQKNLQEQIAEGNAKEEKIDILTIQLRSILAEQARVKEEKEALCQSTDNQELQAMEQLPAILEKFSTYQEFNRQRDRLKVQEIRLNEEIAELEASLQSADTIRQDWKEAQKLEMLLLDCEKNAVELEQEKTALNGEMVKKQRISLMLSAGIGILLMIATGFHPVGILFGGLSFIAGFIIERLFKRGILQKRQQLKEKVKIQEEQKQDIEVRLAGILDRYKVRRSQEMEEIQERIIKQQYTMENGKQQLISLQDMASRTEDSMDEIYEVIMRYVQRFIPEEELSQETMDRLQEEIRHRKQEAAQKQYEIDQRYDDLKLRIEKLGWEISALEGNEEELIKNKARLQQLEEMQKENEQELEAIKLAMDTIKQLSIEIHDSFGRKLNSAVSDIIGNVTNQKYTDVKVDEKLDLKAGWNGVYVPVDRLSAGTLDQFYFALRLAVGELLMEQTEMPLILDESFAHYDESRSKAALKCIANQRQVFLFSCHRREQELLEELRLPYHYVDLSAC